MKDYKIRLITEYAQLKDKINKLDQLTIMKLYLKVLGERAAIENVLKFLEELEVYD